MYIYIYTIAFAYLIFIRKSVIEVLLLTLGRKFGSIYLAFIFLTVALAIKDGGPITASY